MSKPKPDIKRSIPYSHFLKSTEEHEKKIAAEKNDAIKKTKKRQLEETESVKRSNDDSDNLKEYYLIQVSENLPTLFKKTIQEYLGINPFNVPNIDESRFMKAVKRNALDAATNSIFTMLRGNYSYLNSYNDEQMVNFLKRLKDGENKYEKEKPLPVNYHDNHHGVLVGGRKKSTKRRAKKSKKTRRNRRNK
jgi:hypothetical protein